MKPAGFSEAVFLLLNCDTKEQIKDVFMLYSKYIALNGDKDNCLLSFSIIMTGMLLKIKEYKL